jgi:hypothetical protein
MVLPSGKAGSTGLSIDDCDPIDTASQHMVGGSPRDGRAFLDNSRTPGHFRIDKPRAEKAHLVALDEIPLVLLRRCVMQLGSARRVHQFLRNAADHGTITDDR